MDADETTVVLEHEIEPVATRLRCALEAEGYDALVLGGADLVGWSSGYFRYGSGPSAVVVTADGRFTLVVPSVELAVAEADAPTAIPINPFSLLVYAGSDVA